MLPTEMPAQAAGQALGSSRIAVLVPCYNEEAAIGKVVADFRAALPERRASTSTTTIPPTAPSRPPPRPAPMVRREQHQGKGRVVRRMFTDIEADIYVLVDGDATYDAPSAPAMIEKLVRRAARHGRARSGSIARRRPIAPATAPATGC